MNEELRTIILFIEKKDLIITKNSPLERNEWSIYVSDLVEQQLKQAGIDCYSRFNVRLYFPTMENPFDYLEGTVIGEYSMGICGLELNGVGALVRHHIGEDTIEKIKSLCDDWDKYLKSEREVIQAIKELLK